MAESIAAIFNMTLDMLDESKVVSSPDDDTAAARLLNRNYTQTRDEVLSAFPWRFAMSRSSIASTTTPSFGWDYAYAFPTEALRVIPPTIDGEWEGVPIPHEIEGRVILADKAPPLKIRWIKRVEDVTLFTPLFTRAVAAKLATYVSHRFVGKQSYTERMIRIYDATIEEARRVDSLQGTPQRAEQDDWLRSRYG